MQEKELIQRSLQKDETAFAELMLHYQDKIYQHILGIVKDEMMAQDIKQDTFLQAYQKLDTFHGNSSFYTWIYRIAHNKSLNALRSQKKRKEEMFDEAFMGRTTNHDEKWDEQWLLQALEQLPFKQKEVFEKYYFQKIPQKNIAHDLNVPLGTVRSRLFYAKKHLRQIKKSFDNMKFNNRMIY